MAGTRSQTKGKANELAGKTKRAAGTATGSRKLRAKGTAQGLKGRVQDATGRGDRRIKRAANSW